MTQTEEQRARDIADEIIAKPQVAGLIKNMCAKRAVLLLGGTDTQAIERHIAQEQASLDKAVNEYAKNHSKKCAGLVREAVAKHLDETTQYFYAFLKIDSDETTKQFVETAVEHRRVASEETLYGMKVVKEKREEMHQLTEDTLAKTHELLMQVHGKAKTFLSPEHVENKKLNDKLDSNIDAMLGEKIKEAENPSPKAANKLPIPQNKKPKELETIK